METALIVSSILLWLVVLLNLLLTLGLVRRLDTGGRSVSAMGLEAGEPAPDFTAQTLSGETVTRSTYAGRNMAFVFISTHCSPCNEILSHMGPLEPKAARAGVELVLVSTDEMEETCTFVEKQNISLPVLIAPRSNNPFLEDYKFISTPSYCLVNEQGKVQSAGFMSMVGGPWKDLADSWVKRDASIATERR